MMNSSPLKLTVMGLGGIGGMLSAPLLRHYGDSITLVARGRRGAFLRENGLTLRSDVFGSFTVHPTHIVEAPDCLPVQDVVLLCVKNAALPHAAEQLKSIVDEHTVVLPIINGVSAGSELRRLLPCGHILDSIMYTVSSVEPDQAIAQRGSFTTLYIGTQKEEDRQATRQLHDILAAAGIDCRISRDILVSLWEKYVLNCAYNVATARWACTIGDIRGDAQRKQDYRDLMEEAWKVGRARGVALPDDLVERHMKRFAQTTPDSTSSLSRDFDEGRVGEMEVFSGELIRMAEEAGVEVPLTRDYYRGLQERAAAFAKV